MSTNITSMIPLSPYDESWDVIKYCNGSCSMATPYGELSIHYAGDAPDFEEFKKTVERFEQAVNMTIGGRTKPTAAEMLVALNLEASPVNRAFADMLVKNEPELMNEVLYRAAGRR